MGLLASLLLAIGTAAPAADAPPEPAPREQRRLTPFWEGEEVGVRFDPSGAPLAHVSAGLQAGVMPLQVQIAEQQVLAFGLGLRAGWGPMWQVAGVLRAAWGRPEGIIPRLYLQGGPLWLRSALGFELEAGAEAFFGGLFVRSLSEPAADGSRRFTVVVGLKVALVSLVLGAVVASGVADAVGALFGLERS